MLLKCPECELQVSDKALTCPHCGYPLLPSSKKPRQRNKNSKRRRLPNGFGQISEIKNRNLRKPFRAMITVGKNADGRPICKPLKPESYFATYNDAYAALVEYNKNPYDLNPSITVQELYEKWLDEYSRTVKSTRPITSAWAYCTSVYSMRVKEVRARHIKGCLEEGVSKTRGKERVATAAMKIQIKTLFNLMLDYAVEYELVDRNYARTFKLGEEIKEIATVRNEHIPYTEEEMKILWEHVNDKDFVDAIIVQCYSGWRPQEIGLIELNNVDIENWVFRGGIKTHAGINRIVPIHSKIRKLVYKRYEEAQALGSIYLFNYTNVKTGNTDTALTYGRFRRVFEWIRYELKLNPAHRLHDGRKHFVTMAKKYGVDEYAIKYIVGHQISDITERVYTQREFEWLKQEIEKIK